MTMSSHGVRIQGSVGCRLRSLKKGNSMKIRAKGSRLWTFPAGLLICTLALPAEAGSLVVPAWSFARGNGRIHADPGQFADAGPVVSSGEPREKKSWGWTVEYDVDIPVDGKYSVQVRYAAAEARPIEVFVDNRNLGRICQSVTMGSASSSQPDQLTWNSSGARWAGVSNPWGRLLDVSLTKGKHTVKLTRSGQLPHLVALRLDTPETFPESWNPPGYKVRDIAKIPAAYRKAFEPLSNVDVASLRQPVKTKVKTKAVGSMTIQAWTFDRGNVRIYGSPDGLADDGALVGNGPESPVEGVVEYDVEFPVTTEYSLYVSYAAGEARPVEVSVDGEQVGWSCHDVTYGTAPFERPVEFTWHSRGAKDKWEGVTKEGRLVKLSLTKGKHTLKFSRRGPLPHLAALRLESATAFPKDWIQPGRKIRHFDSIPIQEQSVFLPSDSVNVGALRMAIEDTVASFGSRYPDGAKYLKQLAAFEKKKSAVFVIPPPKGRPHTNARVWEGEEGMPEGERATETRLAALRREAMLANPALKFDKLLFVKRRPYFAHIYEDHLFNREGGSLCVLSPVSPDGKVTSLVPELDGGIFTRFDLSFDAKHVVFGYRKKDEPFRIYEIDIDPEKGVMIPGSLQQLTFGGKEEADLLKSLGGSFGRGRDIGFMDTDPIYLPNGNIMFTSTRSQQNIFCYPASVTTLHVMDSDRNLQRISSSPLNEMCPSVLDDGRVIYTRWEYIDKGLGNAQGLWALRPDGSSTEHVFKNNTVRPAGMLGSRSIPGSQRIVTVGAPHCGRQGGPVILIDPRESKRTTKAMTSITPEILYPCMFQVTWHMGFFKDPYPFSEKFFLVSHSIGAINKKEGHYGIYALDAWGNRAPIYSDPEISCFQPIPLRPRRTPPVISPASGTHKIVKKKDKKKEETGTMFMQDVYEGMTGIERGRVKYLRVMAAMPWGWGEKGRFRNGLPQSVHRKKLFGIAKVHEDGRRIRDL